MLFAVKMIRLSDQNIKFKLDNYLLHRLASIALRLATFNCLYNIILVKFEWN